MNREIIFKAKRINNGEWVEGYYIADQDLDDHFICGWNYYTSENGLEREPFDYKIDPNTICQYTGLQDKNGKKIWENDIVAFLDTTSTENGYSEVHCIGKVSWDVETCSFQVSNRTMAESYEVLDGECKLLGNVFDNPDLLEV